MVNRVIVLCSMCNNPININERSLKRYLKIHGTTADKYVCLPCTNGNINLTQSQREKRSENAKKLWQNPDYRKKISIGIMSSKKKP